MNPTINFILAYSLLTLAAILFLWALLWDWFMLRLNRRPNRRCPKCWYNLTHTPGKTCSECGYTAPVEKKLHKSRKRRHYVDLAILLFLAAQITFIYPRVKKRGPIGAIPNWTLIALLPALEESTPNQNSAYVKHPDRQTWRSSLMYELDERATGGELDFLDWHLLIRKCFIGDSQRRPCSLDWQDTYGMFLLWAQMIGNVSPRTIATFTAQHASVIVRVPDRWPADLPVPIYYISDAWWETYGIGVVVDWIDDFQPSINQPDPDLAIAPFIFETISWGEYIPIDLPKPKFNRLPFWKKDKKGHITFTAVIKNPSGIEQIELLRRVPLTLYAPKPTPWSEIISPFQSDELDTFIQDQAIIVTEQLTPKEEGKFYCWVQIDFSALDSYLIEHGGPTIGLTIEVLRNNEVMLTKSGWMWTASPELLNTLPKPVLTIEPGLCDLRGSISKIDFKTPATWQVRLTPNPIAALENLNCNQYWQGKPITIPLVFAK